MLILVSICLKCIKHSDCFSYQWSIYHDLCVYSSSNSTCVSHSTLYIPAGHNQSVDVSSGGNGGFYLINTKAQNFVRALYDVQNYKDLLRYLLVDAKGIEQIDVRARSQLIDDTFNLATLAMA